VNIKFIGTGSGFASLKRCHSSIFISSSGYNLLVDCGDGISRAILKQDINFNSISSILISHMHADHYAGLPALLTQMKLTGRTNNLSIFVHSTELKFIEDLIFHSYLFKERMDFELQIIPIETEKEITLKDHFSYKSRFNSHLDKYKKHDPENKLGFVSLSFLFKDEEKTAIYSGDIGNELDLYLFNQKVDWFIIETSHLKVENLEKVFEKLNPGKIILTHIADNVEETLKGYLESLPKQLKSRLLLASDGFELNQSI
jgi:ribonuclease Z